MWNFSTTSIPQIQHSQISIHISHLLSNQKNNEVFENDEGFDGLNSVYDLDRFTEIIERYDLKKYTWKNQYVYSTNQTHRPNYNNSGPRYFDDDSWSRWIIEESSGLSRAGVELLSESVMVYVWLIITSQLDGKSDIVGDDGKELASQRIFLERFEKDVMKRDFGDFGNLVSMYQKVLIDARSKVDYVVGEGVYMLPSDMRLKLEDVPYYNNKLLVASNVMKIGFNPTINTTKQKHLKPIAIKSKVIIDNNITNTKHKNKKLIKNKTHYKSQKQNLTNKIIILTTFTTLFLVSLYIEYKNKKNSH